MTTANQLPKHVFACPNPDCDCSFEMNPPVFDKTTEWPLYMGRDFVQENIDPINKTWKFDTYVCTCCQSQFTDLARRE